MTTPEWLPRLSLTNRISLRTLKSVVNTALKKIILNLLILILALLLIFPKNSQAIVAAHTVTLSPTEDSWIYEGQPDQNFGSQNKLEVGLFTPNNGATQYRKRALIKFDLSQIPAGSNIGGAELSFTMGAVSGTPPSNVYRVARVNWSESSVKWNNRPDWIDPGVSQSSGVENDTSGALQSRSFNVTSIVSLWLSNPQTYPNFGFYVLGSNSNNQSQYVDFASRETSNKPQLTINYTTPLRTSSPNPSPNPFTNIDVHMPTSPPLPTSPSVPGVFPSSNSGPQISNIIYTATPTSATIVFHTNVNATADIYYGLRGDLSNRVIEQSRQLSQNHSITITNLQSSTEYNFKIAAADGNGNVGYSRIDSFFTTTDQSLAHNLPTPSPRASATPRPSAVSNQGGLFGLDGIFSSNTPIVGSLINWVRNRNQQSANTPTGVSEPLDNIPVIGSVIKAAGNALEDKIAQMTVESKIANDKNAFGNSASESAKVSPKTNNPLVLVASYVGINRLAGLSLIILGLFLAGGALLLLKVSKKTYHHVRKHFKR